MVVCEKEGKSNGSHSRENHEVKRRSMTGYSRLQESYTTTNASRKSDHTMNSDTYSEAKHGTVTIIDGNSNELSLNRSFDIINLVSFILRYLSVPLLAVLIEKEEFGLFKFVFKTTDILRRKIA